MVAKKIAAASVVGPSHGTTRPRMPVCETLLDPIVRDYRHIGREASRDMALIGA
jgi:hypothetical protein